jgi:hypothetical protein
VPVGVVVPLEAATVAVRDVDSVDVMLLGLASRFVVEPVVPPEPELRVTVTGVDVDAPKLAVA